MVTLPFLSALILITLKVSCCYCQLSRFPSILARYIGGHTTDVGFTGQFDPTVWAFLPNYV